VSVDAYRDAGNAASFAAGLGWVRRPAFAALARAYARP